jgi:general secretion pathway protein C
MFFYDHSMFSNRWFAFPSANTFLRLVSLVVWGLVAYSAVVFVLRWDSSSADAANRLVGADQRPQSLPDVDNSAVSKALGAAPPQSEKASLASRFVLVGVMDGGPSHGVALISVDGKPAKPYRVGQAVSEGLVVVATGPKKAELGPQLGASATLVLDLPLKK